MCLSLSAMTGTITTSVPGAVRTNQLMSVKYAWPLAVVVDIDIDMTEGQLILVTRLTNAAGVARAKRVENAAGKGDISRLLQS